MQESNVEQLIRDKAQAMKVELMQWARDTFKVEGEVHIFFTLGLEGKPFVIQKKFPAGMYLMSPRDYFTRERFAAVGASEGAIRKLLKRLGPSVDRSSILLEDEQTFGAFLKIGRSNLLLRKNVGVKMVGMIEKVLEKDGLRFD